MIYMVRCIYKKILIILLMAVMFLIVFNNNSCWALGDVTEDFGWISWIPSVESNSTLTHMVGIILGVIRVIGIIVSVGTLSVIGIKYMLGSVEEKANYKQVMQPWLIGATMVFAITAIPTMIYNVSTNLFVTQNQETNAGKGTYLEGYYYAIEYIKNNAIGNAGVLTNSRIKKLGEEMQKQANGNSSTFFSGAKDAVKHISESKSATLATTFNYLYNEYYKKIENNEINSGNIVEKYENCLQQIVDGSTWEKEEKFCANIIAKYMLYIQMQVWDKTENNNFERYAKGFHQAGDWVRSEIMRNPQLPEIEWFNEIKKKRDRISQIQNKNYDVTGTYRIAVKATYWSGYEDFLRTLLNTCGRAEHIKHCMSRYMETVYDINNCKTEAEINFLIENTYTKEKMGLESDGPLLYASCIIKKINLRGDGGFKQDVSDCWSNGVNSGNQFYLEGYRDAIIKIGNLYSYGNLKDKTAISDYIYNSILQPGGIPSTTYWKGYQTAMENMRSYLVNSYGSTEVISKLYDYVGRIENGSINMNTIAQQYITVRNNKTEADADAERNHSNMDEYEDYKRKAHAYDKVKRLLELHMNEWGVRVYG